MAVRRRRRAWPVVLGAVVASEEVSAVASRVGGSPGQYLVRYSYRVGGVPYQGTESVQRSYLVRSRGFLRRLDSLDEGEEIPVHVSPADPAVSTVAPDGREPGRAFVLVFAGMMTALLALELLGAH